MAELELALSTMPCNVAHCATSSQGCLIVPSVETTRTSDVLSHHTYELALFVVVPTIATMRKMLIVDKLGIFETVFKFGGRTQLNAKCKYAVQHKGKLKSIYYRV